MNLKHHLEKLHYFFAVARVGTIKEAALKLHITQPTLTKSIKNLEEALGKNLFVRLPRGVSLTPEGFILYNFCQDLFRQLEDLEAKLDSPMDAMAGFVKVGTYDSIAIYFWPAFLQKFIGDFPNLEIELMTNRSLVIQQKVESGELDLGLIIEPRPGINLEIIPLATDRFRFYAATRFKTSQLKDLAHSIIYMPDALAGGQHERLEQVIVDQHQRNTPIKFYRTTSLESVKELVSQGLGVGILPGFVADDYVADEKIKVVAFADFPKTGFAEHTIGLVIRSDRLKSSTIQGLVARVQAEFFANRR